MSGLADPRVVRAEYSSEAGLAARRAVHERSEGVDAPGVVFDAVAEARPRRVLEVGCGMGQLAARIREELEVELVALDQSERMVSLTRGRGVDARVGDVQDLPFEDGEFDVVVAAWMLYHAADVEQALDEIVRVLRRPGRLVAATNYPDHFRELREYVGAKRLFAAGEFNGTNGPELLRARFSRVRTVDAPGTVVFPDRAAVLAYVEPSAALFAELRDVPELGEPLVVRRRAVIFVADT